MFIDSDSHQHASFSILFLNVKYEASKADKTHLTFGLAISNELHQADIALRMFFSQLFSLGKSDHNLCEA